MLKRVNRDLVYLSIVLFLAFFLTFFTLVLNFGHAHSEFLTSYVRFPHTEALINFNFLFFKEEQSGSVFNILSYLQEIAPTRLKKLIEAKSIVDKDEDKKCVLEIAEHDQLQNQPTQCLHR